MRLLMPDFTMLASPAARARRYATRRCRCRALIFCAGDALFERAAPRYGAPLYARR